MIHIWMTNFDLFLLPPFFCLKKKQRSAPLFLKLKAVQVLKQNVRSSSVSFIPLGYSSFSNTRVAPVMLNLFGTVLVKKKEKRCKYISLTCCSNQTTQGENRFGSANNKWHPVTSENGRAHTRTHPYINSCTHTQCDYIIHGSA